jgi:hypothetical protein
MPEPVSFYGEPRPSGHKTDVALDERADRYIAVCECGWKFDPVGRRGSPVVKAWEHRKAMVSDA